MRRILGPAFEHRIRLGWLRLAQSPEPHPALGILAKVDALEAQDRGLIERRVRLSREIEDYRVFEADEILGVQQDVSKVLLQFGDSRHTLYVSLPMLKSAPVR